MSAKRKPSGGQRPIPLKKVRAGDAFLAPLEDGRLCVCRVLRVEPDGDVLVGASAWIGTEPPDPADPQLRKLLRLTHHAWGGQVGRSWVIDDPVPANFTRFGVIPPTAKEAALPCASYGGWGSFPREVLRQWRWDHEREQVLAEDEAEQRAEQEAYERGRRAYKPLPAGTLEDLRRETPFAGWSEYTDPIALRESRRIIRETIDALIALGPDAPEPACLDEIDHCVERFNFLDEDDQFIDSFERDDICGLLERIGAFVGLDDYGERPFGARDW
jgi:hypothetical protein